MKNKSLYLTLLSLVLVCACGKPDVDSSVDVSPEIRLNITVANPEGTDSKAVKNAWAEGDKINVWFDANGAGQSEPDLVISYDGLSWNNGSFRDGCTLEPTGYLLALYESYNDLSSAKYSYEWESDRGWFYPVSSQESEAYRCMPMMLTCGNVPYTFTENTLTAYLIEWVFQTRFKVLVQNDDESLTLPAGSYVLQVYDVSGDKYPSRNIAWQLVPGEECPKSEVARGNAVGKTGGVQESDGIAFYYDSFIATSADIIFTLSVCGGDQDYLYVYHVSGKTLDASVNRCTGVSLKRSRFSPPGNITGDIDAVPIDDWGEI